ncbi:MAG: hypothetical protein P4N59_03535 [Negativicutes bacterium]|nr:hypothetical protein [Negativicutes bacterium]
MKRQQEKVLIGIGHTIRALQLAAFGHEEIMAVREAMISGDFSKIEFCEDVFFQKQDETASK